MLFKFEVSEVKLLKFEQAVRYKRNNTFQSHAFPMQNVNLEW